MNLDWRRLRAVVLESDDWGLCAWVPDEQAYRVLADAPAFRGPAGRVYGRSTLETAADVEQLTRVLLEFRGRDGLPPVWQANTIVAAPDYARLLPPLFEAPSLPLIELPEAPSRWRRPELWRQIERAIESGVWWPELHGLHHVPEAAWLRALRRGVADARRAHEHQVFVCADAEASGEYDPSEPADVRTRNLETAFARFRTLFGRAPTSLCPPDYRWDDSLEANAERPGLTTFQGRAERVDSPAPRLTRLFQQFRWPNLRGRRFYLPPRIAFEPRGSGDPTSRVGVEIVHRRVQEAWGRGQPAIVSTHRVNYAHLDPAWSQTGRDQLHDLLERLIADQAVFVTDAEVRQLVERSWSVRTLGERGVLLRHYGDARTAIRFVAPPTAARAVLRDGSPTEHARFAIENGELRAEVPPGEHVIEWRHS
jgi:hypothetical protein